MREQATFTLAELAEMTGSRLVGDPEHIISGFADLKSATADDISFLSHPRYVSSRYMHVMRASEAGAIYVAPKIPLSQGKNFLINEDPSRAFQETIEAIRGGATELSQFYGVHSSATVHPTSQIGSEVTIGPHVIIDADVSIDDHCFIGAGTYIGPHSSLGKGCRIHPNVTIREHCQLGEHVIIQPGVIIGSCGFGYTTDQHGKHTRLKQIGSVTIKDHVEIGANSVIDRSRFQETLIDEGTKIDSLVIIGHNTSLGKHNLICGQSAIAGSTRTGNHVVIAGQCGIDGHLDIADQCIITAKSGVTKSLPSGKYGGNPAQPLEHHNRDSVAIRNIRSHVAKIKELEARLQELEGKR